MKGFVLPVLQCYISTQHDHNAQPCSVAITLPIPSECSDMQDMASDEPQAGQEMNASALDFWRLELLIWLRAQMEWLFSC